MGSSHFTLHTSHFFIIGTRGSPLALTQTRQAAEAIQAANPGVEATIHIVKTTGDQVADAPLTSFGGQGVFVKELERALLSGEIDLAVHSLKDMPVDIPDGLTIAATPRRADARDALISKRGLRLTELPPGAVVAAGSPRRRAQLMAFRPDFRLSEMRGNIDTRLRKLVGDPDLDAMVLACAGLDRMGWGDRITERLSPEVCLPAAGQGALALQTRADDTRLIDAVRRINDAPTEWAVMSERAFLRHTGGGCHTPVGAWARVDDGLLTLDGVLAAPDGLWTVRASVSGPSEQAEALGAALAETILSRIPGRT